MNTARAWPATVVAAADEAVQDAAMVPVHVLPAGTVISVVAPVVAVCDSAPTRMFPAEGAPDVTGTDAP